VANRILDDLVRLLAPCAMRIETKFLVRGGLTTSVVVEHRAKARRARQ